MKKALLIIDMINTLDFAGSEKLLRNAIPVAKNIQRLKKKFTKDKLPVIYVNDNFGKWKSSWEEVYALCESVESKGAKISRMLKPDKNDFFILKPKHSGFFSTNLDTLLEDLKVDQLVITGIAGNICVLFTANDAYMRGYDIHVPRNCLASNTKKDNDYALGQLKDVFKIKISAI